MTPNRFLAVVDEKKCVGFEVCLEKCHFDAVEMKPVENSKKPKASIDLEKCKGCGVCIVGCKADTLTYEIVRPPEYLRPPKPEAPDESDKPVRKIPVWGHYDLK